MKLGRFMILTKSLFPKLILINFLAAIEILELESYDTDSVL